MRLKRNNFSCLRLLFEARFLQRRKLPGLRDFLIRAMTWFSVRLVTFLISSKVMRSAQAAQMTQSALPLGGSCFLTRVTGLLDCFGFMKTNTFLTTQSRETNKQTIQKSDSLTHYHMSNNQVRKKTNIKAANTVWTPKPSSILAMITPEHASMFIIQIKFFTPDHLTQNFRASQEEKFFIPDNLPPLHDSSQLLGQEVVRRLALLCTVVLTGKID